MSRLIGCLAAAALVAGCEHPLVIEWRSAGPHRAVELVMEPITVPNTVSKAWLRLDPTWEPLRGHPGFQRLLSGD